MNSVRIHLYLSSGTLFSTIISKSEKLKGTRVRGCPCHPRPKKIHSLSQTCESKEQIIQKKHWYLYCRSPQEEGIKQDEAIFFSVSEERRNKQWDRLALVEFHLFFFFNFSVFLKEAKRLYFFLFYKSCSQTSVRSGVSPRSSWNLIPTFRLFLCSRLLSSSCCLSVPDLLLLSARNPSSWFLLVAAGDGLGVCSLLLPAVCTSSEMVFLMSRSWWWLSSSCFSGPFECIWLVFRSSQLRGVGVSCPSSWWTHTPRGLLLWRDLKRAVSHQEHCWFFCIFSSWPPSWRPRVSSWRLCPLPEASGHTGGWTCPTRCWATDSARTRGGTLPPTRERGSPGHRGCAPGDAHFCLQASWFLESTFLVVFCLFIWPFGKITQKFTELSGICSKCC